MESNKIWVSFVAMIALAVVMAVNASAFVMIESVTVNGIEDFNGQNQTAAVFAGETIPVRVIFKALENETDVRVQARLRTAGSFSDVSDRFDVIAGNTYSKLLNVKLPSDIDPSEEQDLLVAIESQDRPGATRGITLEIQRESYVVEILSVDTAEQIKAGQILALDVVLKNRGRQEAEDNYVRATIPELGVSNTVYFGDLSPEDQDDPDKEDTSERRIFLSIPRDAKAGVYTVELEAYNADSSTVRTKSVVVTGAGEESRIISPSTSKTFALGEEKTYTLTLVNSGDEIKVYELVIDADEELNVEADQSLVVVPAGTSKNVELKVRGSEEGTYNFAVNVHSEGALVKTESYSATLEGRTSPRVNATVVLTVVLAIIFVVLVIVLIVLLTRKPQKTEEFGESYY